MDERANWIRQHLAESIRVKQQMIADCIDGILAAADVIADAFDAGNKLLLCGNGGSAADCQHMAAEFTSRLTLDFVRPGLPAVALTCDSSFLTAYANDFDFAGVFARGVEALGKPGDVLIGISTSGNSGNVVQAVKQAQAIGMKTIALVGGKRGKLAGLADVTIAIPSTATQHIQEAHLAVEHLICHFVERALYSGSEETASQAA
jgi:D-sedoheptulose 7-phosphate isomerase